MNIYFKTYIWYLTGDYLMPFLFSRLATMIKGVLIIAFLGIIAIEAGKVR